MKIAMLEPKQSEYNVYSRSSTGGLPLLGPVLLGTILNRKGHEVDVINENVFFLK